MTASIACDLGGTFLRMAVVRPDGVLEVTETLRTSTQLTQYPQETWGNIVRSICDYCLRVSSIVTGDAPIVVAVPGPVDERCRILSAPGIVGSFTENPDVCEQLRKLSHRPVYLINDLSAAAWHFASKLNVERALIVSVSSGIGSKMIDQTRRRPVIDDVPFAGEIGHVVVDFSQSAVSCECGGRGHLHSLASGKGIERQAKERALLEPEAFATSACVQRFHGNAASLSNESHIVPAVHLLDAWATSVVRDCTSFLARAITMSAVAAGVQRVVVIGGFAESLGSRYLAILRDEIRSASDYSLLGSAFIESIILGDEKDACLRGAARFSQHERGI